MRKRKKIVKVNFGNLLIVIIFFLLLTYLAIMIFNRFTNVSEKAEKGEESNEVITHLSDLGYEEDDIKNITSNLSDKDIMSLKKKYDNLSDYSKVKYFHIENIDRYDKLSKNSDYSVEEVIMRVNTSIDRDYYTEIKKIENPDDLLVLVNKYYALSSDYEPEDLTDVGNGQVMRKEAAEALLKMMDDMEEDDLDIIAQSGYRSYNTQKSIYDGYVEDDGVELTDTYSARAGHSEHQTGLAIDLSIDGTLTKDFENTMQFDWLSDNAYKYGFIMRYPEDKIYMTGYDYEPWHYRYVGVEVATLIRTEDITYEEYCVKYKGLF